MTKLGFIDEIALLGFNGSKETGLTASDVSKALKPFLDRRRSGLSQALARLVTLEYIEELPRKKGQRSPRWRLRTPGSEALQTIFGGATMKRRSAKPKAIRSLVAAHVLKLNAPEVAAIVKDDNVFAYYLAPRLNELFDARMTVTSLAGLVVAKQLGLSRGDPVLVWDHLIQQGLDAVEDSPKIIEPFAEQVKRAARTARDGWFGSRKLFIHRAWEAWKMSSGETADLPAFKQQLLEALRAGQLELSRADFPMGLESSDLETALTHYGDESYHFITVDEEATL